MFGLSNDARGPEGITEHRLTVLVETIQGDAPKTARARVCVVCGPTVLVTFELPPVSVPGNRLVKGREAEFIAEYVKQLVLRELP